MNISTEFISYPLSENAGVKYLGNNENISQLNEESIIDSFLSEGVILFRGFDTDIESFTQFSNKLSNNFMDYSGGVFNRRVINGNPTILTVNDFNNEVRLHGEMYYQKTIPQMLWFYCHQPASSDGETIICDGKRFYNALNDSLKELFRHKKLRYVSKMDKSAWIKRYKTDNLSDLKRICESNDVQLYVNEDQSIETHFICPIVHPSRSREYLVFINSLLPAKKMYPDSVTFDDGSKIDEDIMLQLNDIAEKLVVEICWEKGDILMIDNTRIMHGRRAFLDDNREIYLRLCSPSFL
ncbi:TauD/TfdA family dioxygenase [Acaryochloris marina]|uniref:TauD/TfdA family dioxygenase n=1 Tax=Acaryochloris marina TaxID=155978 RepID=UPI0021C4753D|nr:TauD/TfdA family dioxygenase [Acaryochloris marina]BDM83939.1 hypothetical protein AM10699_68000 [Acaryochloris marina MBIC10699]